MRSGTDKKGVEDRVQSGLRRNLNLPWEQVLHLAKKYEYPKRNRVRFSKDMDVDFYYLAQGRVCLQVSSPAGKERMTNYFGEGCLFNLAAVFYQGFEDSGSWVFLEDSIIWRFPGSLLHDEAFVSRYPALIINLMQSISFNMLTQYTWLTEMFMADPLPRVSRYLIGLAAAAGSEDCIVGITQQDAALQLGMHRGTLSAALKELKEKGVIAEFSRGRLRILDITALRRLSTS